MADYLNDGTWSTKGSNSATDRTETPFLKQCFRLLGWTESTSRENPYLDINLDTIWRMVLGGQKDEIVLQIELKHVKLPALFILIYLNGNPALPKLSDFIRSIS